MLGTKLIRSSCKQVGLTHLASVEYHLLYVSQSDGPRVGVPPDTRAEATHARHFFEELTHRDN